MWHFSYSDSFVLKRPPPIATHSVYNTYTEEAPIFSRSVRPITLGLTQALLEQASLFLCPLWATLFCAPSTLPRQKASSFPSWLTRLNSSFTENMHMNQKGDEESDSSLIPLSRFFSYVICSSGTWLFPLKETMQLRMWMCRPVRRPSHLTLWCLSFLMGEIDPSIAHRLSLQDETHCIRKAFRGQCPHMSPLQEPVTGTANRKFSLATSPKLSTWACVCAIIFHR